MRITSVVGATLMLGLAGASLGQSRIIITEIMYNPASDEQNSQTEWVEIANVGDEAAEMKSWRLDDEDQGDWSPFDAKLEPGEVLVLYNKAAVGEAEDFFAAWGDLVPAKGDPESEQQTAYQAIGVEWGSLANRADAKNEVLQLLDGDGEVVCEVNYHSDGDWPNVSRPDGSSIWLTDLAGDLNDGKIWKASESGKSGARAVKAGDVFNARDIGSPGFVPGLDGPVREAAKDTSDAGKEKKKTGKGDDEIDY